MTYPFEVRHCDTGAVISRHRTRSGAERSFYSPAHRAVARIYYMGRPS